MKQRILSLLVVISMLPASLLAQDYLGFSSSNYAGVNALFLQPASIVDSRYIVDINLVGLDVNFQNNFVGVRWKDLASHYNSNADFRSTYLVDNYPSTGNKNVYLYFQAQGPSASFNINRKSSLAIFTRVRVDFNLDNITPQLAKQAYEGLTFQPLWGTTLNNQSFSAQAMAWAEYGFTYGREIFTTKNGKHYLKAAVTFKLEQGLGSAFMFANNLNYNFKNNDTLTINNSKFSYGHSSNFDFTTSNLKTYTFISNPTIGFDMGMVYEWRPDIDKYIGDVGRDEGKPMRDKNKYKLKVGFSLLDIGRLKYTKGGISGDFTANMVNHNIHDFKPSNVATFNDSIQNLYGFSQTAGQAYYVNLPTAMSFQVDYNIWKGFYANFTPYISFPLKNDISKMHTQTNLTLALRYEHKWFDFGIPFSYNTTAEQLQLGAYIRLGVLVIGTNNIIPYTKDVANGANVYMALKIPIPYGKAKESKHKAKVVDTDGDGVPDDIDKCPTIPGPPENFGCPWPDRDSDGVADKDDSCPDIKGPAENHGCPWPDTDKDGVPDKDDSCPTVAGPVENHGCPWPDADKDGVPDKDDSCPTVAGPVENHGCPWPDFDKDGVPDKDDSCPKIAGPVENHGCPWPDTDGDGVPDKDDLCPLTPGPASNHGCPVLEKREIQILKKAFDNLQFVSGKAIIAQSSYASLANLASLLKSKPDAKLLIAGHTDNTGSHELNMKLSRARAESVRDALMKRGVKEDQLVVEYYGETKPIATNDTPEGKQKNRRVEMTMSYK